LTTVQSVLNHSLVDSSTLLPLQPPAARFKTAQVLAWVGLNSQTLRYWKSVLEPIAGRDGRSAWYTLEEVVALAVINRATTQLNVPISCFTSHANEVFAAVAAHMSDTGQPNLVFIHDNEITFGSVDAMPPVEALAIVRIDRVLLDVRTQMTAPAIPPSQFNLF
jgi:hypothetical protein